MRVDEKNKERKKGGGGKRECVRMIERGGKGRIK